ncbi:hypothetical protein PENTCL1PPCAC_28166, partial [Pristionchus entomophagus]
FPVLTIMDNGCTFGQYINQTALTSVSGNSPWEENLRPSIDPADQIMYRQPFAPVFNPAAPAFEPQNQSGMWNYQTPSPPFSFVSSSPSGNWGAIGSETTPLLPGPTPLMMLPVPNSQQTHHLINDNQRRDSDDVQQSTNIDNWKRNRGEDGERKATSIQHHLEECEIVDGVPTYYFPSKHKENIAKVTYHEILPRVPRNSASDTLRPGEPQTSFFPGYSLLDCPAKPHSHQDSAAGRGVNAEVREMFNQLTM